MTTARGRQVSPLVVARVTGALYLVVIVLGIFTELFVRSRLIVPGDPASTAGNIVASETLFRLGFLTDSVVFLSDAALAVLLYVLLRPVGRTLALVAAAFRLTQTAVLSLNLLAQHAALLLLGGEVYASAFAPDQLDALVHLTLELHAHGYDLGLLFFGVHCLLLGYLVVRSTYLPTTLGVLLGGAAFAYLLGGYTRFIIPELLTAVSPIYVLAFVSEVSLCLWLLVKGVDTREWERWSPGAAAA